MASHYIHSNIFDSLPYTFHMIFFAQFYTMLHLVIVFKAYSFYLGLKHLLFPRLHMVMD